jgi:hypothetical protein
MRRVRIEIGELRVHGASPLEASRLRDALVRELSRAAAGLPAVQPRQVEQVDGGRVRVPDRIDRQAEAVAAAVLAGLRP